MGSLGLLNCSSFTFKMSHALKLGLGVREFLPNWPVVLLNMPRLQPNEVALRVLPK
jgi:hypothetical protein